jgi:hypothetical protein
MLREVGRWLRTYAPSLDPILFANELPKMGVLRTIVSAVRLAGAHRGDRKRFILHADDEFAAFVEFEATIRAYAN